MPTNLTTKVNRMQVAEWLSQGKSRKFIMDSLVASGITPGVSRDLYYDTLKDFIPATNLIDEHKKAIIQQNLDRLEKIIEDCIDGNTGDKKVALNAIAELNKMCGVYESNKVTIAKNQEGDEMIQISFDK